MFLGKARFYGGFDVADESAGIGSSLRAGVLGLFFVVLCGLVLYSLVGRQGRVSVLRMEAEIMDLEHRIEALKVENKELELTVAQLRRPGFAAEWFAREKLGLVKRDERLFLELPAP